MQPPRTSNPGQGDAPFPSTQRRQCSPPAKRRRTSSSSLPSNSSASNSSSRPASPEPSQSPQYNPAQAATSSKWFRKPSVVWYRGNDLRVDDHPALLQAAQRGGPVLPLFVWDPNDSFGSDLGVVKRWWLRESLRNLQHDLRRLGVQLYTRTGCSTTELRKFLQESGADAVFWNRCYEPDLLQRDEELRDELALEGLTAESFKAELLVEPWELSDSNVSPCYDTFHEYMRAWMRLPPPPQPFPCPSRLQSISRPVKSTSLEDLGIDFPSDVHERMRKLWAPGSTQAKVQLERFLREVFPAFGDGRCRRHFEGTSRLSPHIRFGEISPRRMYHATRLRVLRWDPNTVLNMQGQAANMSRSRSVGKSRSSATAREEKGRKKAFPTLKNGTGPSKRRRWDNNSASTGRVFSRSASPDQCERPRSPKSKSEALPVNKSNAKDMSKCRRRSSIVQKKLGLPHISLSARAFLKNLCLRDFSYHVLFHNTDFNSKPLIPEFSNFPWADDTGGFETWLHGRTGYPIVDAAMRELRETGWVHNRMRFLLACFLTKYLLLPWSRGLKEFYGLLLDGDHSANALGWQWTAGSNTDAFPLSCLVNPVKVAYRHDTTGNYVRKWIPELASLPNKYIHEPWKAAVDELKPLGIEIGKTYPHRVIKVADARSRALDAMLVMKKLFSSSSVSRGIFSGKDEDIKEWPEEQQEVLQEDESSSSGKVNLLPSLWALLQGDHAASHLSSPLDGNDALIAMDTASLAEGALAVPLDDQHESIEHALITAHEHVPAPPHFSSPEEQENDEEHSLDVSSFANATSGDQQVLETGSGEHRLGHESLDGQLKYEGPDCNAPHQDEKLDIHQAGHVQISDRSHLVGEHNHRRLNEGVGNVPFSSAALVPTSSPVSGPSVQGHLALPQQQQQQQQHMQHMQQLQQLQQLHQLQQFQLQQQQQQSSVVPQQRPHPISLQLPSQSAPPRQHHAGHAIIDEVYGSAGNSNSMPGGSAPAAPVTTAPPVLMGPMTSVPEANLNTAFPGGDSVAAAAAYGHHFGMAQFYGMHQVMPMMNGPGMNGTERMEGPAAPTQSARPKVAVQGLPPMGYGMYGSGMFDAAVLANPFASGTASYGGLPVSSQQQSAGAQPGFGIHHPHAMYFGGATGVDMHYPPSNGNVQQSVTPVGTAQKRLEPQGQAAPNTSPTVAAAAAAVAAGGRELEMNVVSDTRNTHAMMPNHGLHTLQDDISQGAVPQPSGAQISREKTKTVNRRNGMSQQQKGSHGRANAKAISKGKGTGRNRRSSASGSQGKNRADGRDNISPRSRSTDGGASKGGGKGKEDRSQNHAAQTTSLKTRQEILAAVLEKKDHEYHGFAQFLSITYELTGNTDRHTSKDYIRLCNLKDDYHKQCNSEKEKLKIYRIKAFFSKILKLEVTGEWDRHNHGGVRGPYVYGICVRKRIDGSQTIGQS